MGGGSAVMHSLNVCFAVSCYPKQAVEQTAETLVVYDAVMLISMT